MTSNAIFLAGLALFDGLAVVWGAWEFWSARPTKKADAQQKRSNAKQSAKNSGHPER